jgi:hypothetical protein
MQRFLPICPMFPGISGYRNIIQEGWRPIVWTVRSIGAGCPVAMMGRTLVGRVANRVGAAP